MSRKDEELIRFLQNHAPVASEAPKGLEEELILSLRGWDSLASHSLFSREKAWPWVSGALAAAALLAGLVWFRPERVEPMNPIAEDLEESWDGVLATNQDIGLQSLFSDLD